MVLINQSSGYLMLRPDATTEQERLGQSLARLVRRPHSREQDLQHQVWLLSLNGRLYQAPLGDHIGAILDLGCGTGAWALAIAKERPESQVIGTDLTPPTITPPENLCILESDADKPWDFDTKFGFIHSRMLTSGIHDWPALLSRCWDHLRPGGWVEFLDVCHPFRAQDPAADNDSSGLIKWGHVAERCWARQGLDYRATEKHRERLQERGFINVREEKVRWPLGEWADSVPEKHIGRLTMDNFLTFMATAGESIIDQDPWLSAQEKRTLVADAQKDLKEHGHSKQFYLTM
ncbi:MAG: hypothetical protein Q9207_000448 [Kuettlingeria erythrocarpa]